jgi:hypothetical protein
MGVCGGKIGLVLFEGALYVTALVSRMDMGRQDMEV